MYIVNVGSQMYMCKYAQVWVRHIYKHTTQLYTKVSREAILVF